ncbi:hypothetical protein OC844_005346 [Tilletia horrida]|nr:hypothetical protein OC844_005346 [Tilletia horrida]
MPASTRPLTPAAAPAFGFSASILRFAVLVLALFHFFPSTPVRASSLRSIGSSVFVKLADLNRPPALRQDGNSPYIEPLSSDNTGSSESFGMGWKTVDTPVVRLFDGSINQPGFAIVPTGADGKLQSINASASSALFPGNQRMRHVPQPKQKKPAYPGPSSFTPLNPPSIPLIVKGPYLNAWLPSGSLLSATPPNKEGNGGYLAGQYPGFWTSGRGADGDFRLGTHGYIRIDNTTYQWMGDGFGNIVRAGKNANQLSFEYTATRSVFKFEADGVYFTVTFLTPITPDDYLRQSLPLSYVHFELDELSAKNRKVQLYVDIDERWVTGHDYDYQNYPYHLDFADYQGTSQYFVTRNKEQVLTEYRQRAEWGSASFAMRNRVGMSSINQNNIYAQIQFINNGSLNNEHFQIGGPDNSFAFAVDFTVANSTSDALFAIGHFRIPYVSMIKARKQGDPSKGSYRQWRYGYWQAKYPSIADAVVFFLNDFESALENAIKFDQMIEDESKAVMGGGAAGDAFSQLTIWRPSDSQYAAITALSVRQAMATIEITISKNSSGAFNPESDPVYVTLKEISSNGDFQTVDVIFPAFPIFSFLNPNIIRDLLEPIFKYTMSGLYPNKWCVHDLGVYPVGFGHNDGKDEPMPVEESGNMIGMVLHWAQLVGNKTAVPYLKERYAIMAQWANFLIEDSLIPASQLSTDDFAGTASNQTDLAIKGIIGIAALGEIAALIGQDNDAAIYRNISQNYISAWQYLATDQQKTHTKLVYQQDNSWGTLYNLFLDRLLNLNLVSRSVYEMQDAWYPQVAQKYGVPLDSRHTWTKSDWAIFTAATSVSTSTRDLFVQLVHKFVSNGQTDVPFTDLYETVTGDLPKYPFDPTVSFMARPVVGGHFAPLAKQKGDAANGVTEYAFGPEPTKTAYTDAEINQLIKDSVAMETKLSTAGKRDLLAHRRAAARNVLQ